jgi:hypothetical protein
MDWPLFLLLLAVFSLGTALAIITRLSDLSGKGIRATLREYWQTFFGGDELPNDEGKNPRLD